MDIAVGELKAAGSTDDTQVNLTDSAGNKLPGHQTFFPKVIAGTFKFGIGSTTHADAHGWTSADDIPPITWPQWSFRISGSKCGRYYCYTRRLIY